MQKNYRIKIRKKNIKKVNEIKIDIIIFVDIEQIIHINICSYKNYIKNKA